MKEAVPVLISVLVSGEETQRAGAAYLLAAIGEPAVASLADQLGSQNDSLRKGAAGALAVIGRPALPVLFKALRGADNTARIAALDALGSVRSGVDQVVPALLLMIREGSLGDDSARVALFKLGPEGKSAAPDFIRIMNADPDPAIRGLAVHGLGCIGPAAADQAVPAIIALLKKDKDLGVVRESTWVLGRMGPAAAPAVPVLARLLEVWSWNGESEDKSELTQIKVFRHHEIRRNILQALSAIGSSAAESVIPVLTAYLAREKDPELLQETLRTLSRMGPAGRQAVASSLVKTLESQKERNAAADEIEQMLLEVGTPEALTAVARFREKHPLPEPPLYPVPDQPYGGQEPAAPAGGEAPPEEDPLQPYLTALEGKSVPELLTALKDPDMLKAQAAVQTLISMEPRPPFLFDPLKEYCERVMDSHAGEKPVVRNLEDMWASPIVLLYGLDRKGTIQQVLKPAFGADPVRRLEAAKFLYFATTMSRMRGTLGEDEVQTVKQLTPELNGALNDADPWVRVFSACALLAADPKGNKETALPVLKQAVRQDMDENMRMFLQDTLAQFDEPSE